MRSRFRPLVSRRIPSDSSRATLFVADFRLAGELLSLRKACGLTQRQLSQKTGIQQSEISRIEAAHANPTLGTVSALARALGAEVRLVAGKKRAARSRGVVRARGAPLPVDPESQRWARKKGRKPRRGTK